MRSFIALMSAVLLVSLVGCGPSLPTENDAKQFIQRHSTEGDHAPLILLSFQKTNGTNGRNLQTGVEEYTMDCEYEIKFVEDCFFGHSWTLPRKLSTNYFGSVAVKRGETAKISTKIIFSKTENGWQPWICD